jgi:hypothetical protein
LDVVEVDEVEEDVQEGDNESFPSLHSCDKYGGGTILGQKEVINKQKNNSWK